MQRTDWWTYVGELAHCIGFDSNVVLFEFLLDLVDACGDVFGLWRDSGESELCGSDGECFTSSLQL